MGQKVVTLELPDELYNSVNEAAAASDRPVEAVLLESLSMLFHQPSGTDFDAELTQLTDYSIPQLWAVVYRRLPWSESLRLRDLNAKAKQNALTNAEQAEVERLLDRVDRAMLLRSEALLLLKQHGVDVDAYLKIGA